MSSNNTNNLAPSGSSGVTAPTTSTVVVSSSSAAVVASSAMSVAGPSRPDTSVPVGSSPAPRVSRPLVRLIPGLISNPDRETFMDLYDWGDVTRLERWVEDNRGTRGVRGYMVGRPPLSDAFASFLLQQYGRAWESRLLAGQGEVLLFQLRCLILGYSRLTSFQRGQFRRLWPAWTNSERVQQLKKLVEMGGYLELE